MKNQFILLFVFTTGILLDTPILTAADKIWGWLANPDYGDTPIKSTVFFSGSSRNGVQYYDLNPTPNTSLYTLHPLDAQHLAWSENQANREYAFNAINGLGINVINMSYWGPPGTDNWAYWAPMQTSTQSNDELFQVVNPRAVYIAPLIESCAATALSPGYAFMDCFPGSRENPAPELVIRIEDLVHRYLLEPKEEDWPLKWAQAFDSSGEKRYIVALMHVASNQPDVTDQQFAEGFDRVAEKVYQDTGIRVGFTLDIMPRNSYAPGLFRPSPEVTGPWLVQQESIIAVQCFLSEIWIGIDDKDFLLKWKGNFISRWVNTGIPFILDTTPGYDAHIVFPGSVVYGNTASWREGQNRIAGSLGCQGVAVSAFNGYTEGFAGVPTQEYGEEIPSWIYEILHARNDVPVHCLPEKIEAESFTNMSGIAEEITQDDWNGYDVGWMDDGDWMDYPVCICQPGQCIVYVRVAQMNDEPGEGQFEMDGNILASFSVPGTGGWQNWQTIKTVCTIPQDAETLRLKVIKGGWNINWFEFRRIEDMKYYGIPGRIEAEYYDDMVGVQTEIVTDTERGFNIGWLDAGDWLEYLVAVKEPGDYNVSFRVALDNSMPGGQGRLIAGDDVLCRFDIPTTGGWQNWETITQKVTLKAGKQTLRMAVVKGPWNFNWMKFSRENTIVRDAEGSEITSPNTIELYQNYPNPFNQSTILSFYLYEPGPVTLKVFDVNGKEIASLLNYHMAMGEHRIQWQVPQELASGLYYQTLRTGDRIDIKKMILLK
jgi:hypothetical protein